MTNPAAQAWIDASHDLGIEFVHPFTFTTKGGRKFTTTGGLVSHFGSPTGTLVITRYDSVEVSEASEDTDFCLTGLNPNSYEPYHRDTYIETLNEWGWFGPNDKKPLWFADEAGHHGSQT